MEQQKWTPRNVDNPGEFGAIVHSRVAEELKRKRRWLANVYVRNGTNEIIAIGVHPGGEDHTEIDALCLKKGVKKPKVGDILDPGDIESIYDVKTSASGAIPQEQRQRLKAIRRLWVDSNNLTEQLDDTVKSVRPRRRWSYKHGQFANTPRINNALRLFSVLGITGYVGGLLDTEAQAQEMDDILREARKIQSMQRGSQERMLATSLWLLGPVRTYLTRMVPNDSAVNVAIGVGVRKVLRDFIDPLEGDDPCAYERQ